MSFERHHCHKELAVPNCYTIAGQVDSEPRTEQRRDHRIDALHGVGGDCSKLLYNILRCALFDAYATKTSVLQKRLCRDLERSFSTYIVLVILGEARTLNSASIFQCVRESH